VYQEINQHRLTNALHDTTQEVEVMGAAAPRRAAAFRKKSWKQGQHNSMCQFCRFRARKAISRALHKSCTQLAISRALHMKVAGWTLHGENLSLNLQARFCKLNLYMQALSRNTRKKMG